MIATHYAYLTSLYSERLLFIMTSLKSLYVSDNDESDVIVWQVIVICYDNFDITVC